MAYIYINAWYMYSSYKYILCRPIVYIMHEHIYAGLFLRRGCMDKLALIIRLQPTHLYSCWLRFIKLICWDGFHLGTVIVGRWRFIYDFPCSCRFYSTGQRLPVPPRLLVGCLHVRMMMALQIRPSDLDDTTIIRRATMRFPRRHRRQIEQLIHASTSTELPPPRQTLSFLFGF